MSKVLGFTHEPAEVRLPPRPAGGRNLNGRPAFRSVLAAFITALLLGTGAADASQAHSITAVAIDPQTPTTLYAATTDRGVFKSVDAGTTWRLTGLIGIRVTSLAIDVANPGSVYAGTRGNGVFRFTSAGNGGIWVATGLPGLDVTAVVIDPIPATTLYALVPGIGVFKSTNGGGTWGAILRSDDIPCLCNGYYFDSVTIYALVSAPAPDPATPATLYAGVSYVLIDSTLEANYWAEVIKITDGGSNRARIGPQRVEHRMGPAPGGYGGDCDRSVHHLRVIVRRLRRMPDRGRRRNIFVRTPG